VEIREKHPLHPQTIARSYTCELRNDKIIRPSQVNPRSVLSQQTWTSS